MDENVSWDRDDSNLNQHNDSIPDRFCDIDIPIGTLPTIYYYHVPDIQPDAQYYQEYCDLSNGAIQHNNLLRCDQSQDATRSYEVHIRAEYACPRNFDHTVLHTFS